VSGRLLGEIVLDQDEERWLTYAQAGRLLGISLEAVRQLARRRGWPRRTLGSRHRTGAGFTLSETNQEL
jgi:hypothetical protein